MIVSDAHRGSLFDPGNSFNYMRHTLMSNPSWLKFSNSTLRFSILRAICIFAILLLCNVPKYALKVNFTCREDPTQHDSRPRLSVQPKDMVDKYEIMRMTYSYLLYSFTLLHHFASAFGPRSSLPGIIDFVLIVGETILFMLEAIVGRWAVPIRIQIRSVDCEVQLDYLGVPTTVVVFTWTISLLLLLFTAMRITQALASTGRYLWAAYDIAGLDLKPRRDKANEESIRPNGLQVLIGVKLWEAHFKSEGRWIVWSRGVVAIITIILVLGLALNSLIIDPIHETDEFPVKISTSRNNPSRYLMPDYFNVIVGIKVEFLQPPLDLASAVKVAASPVPDEIFFSHQGRLECEVTPPAVYQPLEPYDFVPFGESLHITKFRCLPLPTLSVNVSVDFSRIREVLDSPARRYSVQVMIGHSQDINTTIRRTELPVVLYPGMHLLGFARKHKVRQFRKPGLSAFGLYAPFDEFILSEITHLQPRSLPILTSDDTASLMVYQRDDYSDIKIIQDYREKTVLKGFSDIGGLWTFMAFFFGAFFGSSLVRVAFGLKPISIAGLAHNAVEEETLQKYREAYPFLDSDIEDLRARAGLLTLLVDHLIDLDLFTKATATNLPDTAMDEEGIQMTTAHCADDLTLEERGLAALCATSVMVGGAFDVGIQDP